MAQSDLVLVAVNLGRKHCWCGIYWLGCGWCSPTGTNTSSVLALPTPVDQPRQL
jgi:hypothetical protein